MNKFSKDDLYLIKDFLEERVEEYTASEDEDWRQEVVLELERYQEMYSSILNIIESLIKE